MIVRRILSRLLGPAPVAPRDTRLPIARTEIAGPVVTPARRAKLVDDGRQAIEILLRTRVEHDGHFAPPRFTS